MTADQAQHISYDDERGIMMITVNDIINSEEVKTFLSIAETQMRVLGYTEHSFRHVKLVSDTAGKILQTLGFPDREVELARIAGYLHDIGNAVNRIDHAHTGAIMAYQMLTRMGMDYKEAAEIKGYKSEVAGDVDVFVVPNITTGNVLGKSLIYAANGKMAGLIVGAKVPIVLTSRGSSAEEKFLSLVLAAATS
mgnify:CR=1 FL=1